MAKGNFKTSLWAALSVERLDDLNKHGDGDQAYGLVTDAGGETLATGTMCVRQEGENGKAEG